MPKGKPTRVPPGKPLNLRQQRFVQEYLVDGIAAAAARRAGYSVKSSLYSGHQLTKNPRVKAAIAAEKAARAAPMTREAAVEALRRIASANVLDYARPGADGALELDLWRLERDRGGAVRELTVTEKTDPKTGVVTRTVGFRLADRSAALIKLLPMLRSPTEQAANWRGWLAGAEAVAEMSPEQFGRFQALRAEMTRGHKAVAIDEVVDAFWDRETQARATQQQAALDEALTAREAELDALEQQLDSEWEDLSAERGRLTEQAHRLERQRAEAAEGRR